MHRALAFFCVVDQRALVTWASSRIREADVDDIVLAERHTREIDAAFLAGLETLEDERVRRSQRAEKNIQRIPGAVFQLELVGRFYFFHSHSRAGSAKGHTGKGDNGSDF